MSCTVRVLPFDGSDPIEIFHAAGTRVSGGFLLVDIIAAYGGAVETRVFKLADVDLWSEVPDKVVERPAGSPDEELSGVCHCGQTMEGHPLDNHSPVEMLRIERAPLPVAPEAQGEGAEKVGDAFGSMWVAGDKAMHDQRTPAREKLGISVGDALELSNASFESAPITRVLAALRVALQNPGEGSKVAFDFLCAVLD